MRERERDSFSCIHERSVFSNESGMKRDKREKGQREGERNRSQVRVHFDNVTSKHGMHATHHYFRLYRFFLFLSSVFLPRLTRCIIMHYIVARKK